MILTLVILLLALMIRKRAIAAQPVEIAHGQMDVTVLDFQTFVCLANAFPKPFTDDHVAVHLSPARSPNAPPMYEASTVWVEQVSRHNFTVCVDPSAAIIIARVLKIHWLAFRSQPSSGMSGMENIPLWTTGTKCVLVTYSKRLNAVPAVLITAMHQGRRTRHDAATAWTEDVTPEDFKICIREIKNFDCVHLQVKVRWLVLDSLPPEWTQAKVKGLLSFPNTLAPPKKYMYSYCQDFSFPKVFFTTPTLIVTPSHRNNIYSSRNVWPQNNAITYWIENLSTFGYQICVKDLQPYRVHHDPIIVSYLALGDLHPCLDVTCGNYAKCKAYGAVDVRCECDKVCPFYEEEVCGSNGVTYTNRCTYNQMVCNTGHQFNVVKSGSCKAFVLKHGRVPLKLDTVYRCQTLPFGHNFTQNKTLHVFISIDYHNTTQTAPHDTVAIWVENVSPSTFDACLLKAGRNDHMPADGGLTFINYVAYEGSPADCISGVVTMDTWWDGTACKSVTLPSLKFSSTPYVLVTAKHSLSGLKHDAATIWIEDLNTSGFRICLRELQSFDCMHKSIYVHWLALNVFPEGIQSEQHKVTFMNKLPPPVVNAFCKNLNFVNSYSTVPTIVLSANHYTGPGGLVPQYNSISTWVENMNTTQCTICIRESRGLNGHDPVSVTAVILG